jgi:hypothetical protein
MRPQAQDIAQHGAFLRRKIRRWRALRESVLEVVTDGEGTLQSKPHEQPLDEGVALGLMALPVLRWRAHGGRVGTGRV